MKFLTLFAAGAAASAVAPRAVSDIISAIENINTQTTALNAAIQAITGPQDRDAVVSASEAVLSAISSATSTVNAESTISLEDALRITTPVNTLGQTVGTAIDSIIAKKSIIDAAGLSGTALSQLQQQQTAAQGLVDAIKSKIDPAAAPIADSVSAPILSNLQRGVTAYAGSTDTPTGGSSSSSVAQSSSAASSASSASSAVISSSYAASSSSAASTTVTRPGTNTTVPTYSATGPAYTGAAVANVASFGGILAAAAVVAAF